MKKYKITVNAFNVVEIVVVIAIVAIIAVAAVPAYNDMLKRMEVTKMVNKLGTFKLAMTDTYLASSIWPAAINGASAGTTISDTFFNNAINFRYNTLDNKAWVGYQLSADYGSGWIFLVLIANEDDSFAVHCGSLDNTCTLGYCNSLDFFPTQCKELDLDSSYTLE